MGDGELGNETAGCDGEAGHDEGGAGALVIGPPGEDYGEDRCENVDGNREELCICAGVAKAIDDRWDGGGEAACALVNVRSK